MIKPTRQLAPLPINTMRAWRPILRPVASLIIAAQLALLLNPSSLMAQERGTVNAGNVQGQLKRQSAWVNDKAVVQKVQAGDDLQRIQELVDANTSVIDTTQRSSGSAQLLALLSRQPAAQAAMRAELAAIRQDLVQKNLPAEILARHDQAAAQFEQRSQEFNQISQRLQNNEPQAAQALQNFLIQNRSGVRRSLPAAQPDKLPWGNPQPSRRMPAESKSSWIQHLHKDYYAAQAVKLAQAGGSIGGIQFTQLPEPGLAPTTADLSETLEVQITPVIQAKALALSNNPVSIHNWVRNNIQWQPTWGASQDATALLKSQRGNSADIASLEIALLRAAGIPARYQFGTIDIPIEQAMNWAGGLQNPEAALTLFNQGGIAARGITEAGRFTAIRMEHVWVQAYVNWSPSRGARQGGRLTNPETQFPSGQAQHVNPNGALNAWVPLDASFKQYNYAAGLDMSSLGNTNAQGLLDAAKQGAVCTSASAAGLNTTALVNGYSQFNAQALSQLNNLGNNTRIAQILGSESVLAQDHSMLAGNLPYPVVIEGLSATELPASLRWRASLSLLDGTTSVLALDRALAQVQGQSLDLSFVPETALDAQTLATLLRPSAGGDANGLPTKAAAYLVKFKAQLRSGTQVLAEGGSYFLGQALTLRSTLQNPNQASAPSSQDDSVVVGETHAWALRAGNSGAQGAADVAAQALGLQTQLAAGSTVSASEQASAWLGLFAQTFQSTLDAKLHVQQKVSNTVQVRLPSLVRVSSRLEVDEAFGLVTYVRSAGVGFHLDNYGLVSAPRSSSANTNTSAEALQQSLERASAAAHQLLDRVLGGQAAPPAALSAISGFAAAVTQGQTVYAVDVGNISQVLPPTGAASHRQWPACAGQQRRCSGQWSFG